MVPAPPSQVLPADEPVEVVDADGVVLSVVSRGAMRAANERHRVTYVVVRDHAGAVLVHQRAAWKDIWPSRWDLAFGGVCAVGEAWRDAALRELSEEAGIAADPQRFVDFGPVRFESAETRVVGRAYGIEHEGPFAFADGEVVAHRWVVPAALRDWAATHLLCADTVALVVPLVLDAWCDEKVTRAAH